MHNQLAINFGYRLWKWAFSSAVCYRSIAQHACTCLNHYPFLWAVSVIWTCPTWHALMLLVRWHHSRQDFSLQGKLQPRWRPLQQLSTPVAFTFSYFGINTSSQASQLCRLSKCAVMKQKLFAQTHFETRPVHTSQGLMECLSSMCLGKKYMINIA